MGRFVTERSRRRRREDARNGTSRARRSAAVSLASDVEVWRMAVRGARDESNSEASPGCLGATCFLCSLSFKGPGESPGVDRNGGLVPFSTHFGRESFTFPFVLKGRGFFFTENISLRPAWRMCIIEYILLYYMINV